MLSPTRLSAALVPLLLVLSGCGSDNDGGEAEPPGAASAFDIGVLVNLTGPDAGENLVPPVLKAWAAEANANGGVAGHPVNLQFEDTKGDAPTGTAAANRLIGDEVDAIVMFDAYAEGVYGKKIEAAGIPVIGGMGYDPTVWGALRNWFPVTTTYPSFVNSTMVLADSLGDGNVGYVVCAEAPTCAGIGETAKSAAETLAIDYAGTFTIAAATPDYTAECLALIDAGVDFVALTHIATVNMRFAKHCQTQGYTGHLALNAGGVQPAQMLANDPGVRLDLAMNAFPWWAEEGPAASYRALMSEHGVAEAEWADPRSAAAYATMELFRSAMEANADAIPSAPQKADVIAAYGLVESEDLDGLLPQPVTFTADQPGPPVTCYWNASYEDGEFGGGLADPVCDPDVLSGP